MDLEGFFLKEHTDCLLDARDKIKELPILIEARDKANTVNACGIAHENLKYEKAKICRELLGSGHSYECASYVVEGLVYLEGAKQKEVRSWERAQELQKINLGHL